MPLRTNKVKQVQSAGNPWKSKYGDDMYPWEVEMEGGDVGTANTKDADPSKAWPVGGEVTYNVEETDKGNKFQRVYDNPAQGPKSGSSGSKGSNASFALSYAKDLGVAYVAAGKLDGGLPENIKKTASGFKKWLDEN